MAKYRDYYMYVCGGGGRGRHVKFQNAPNDNPGLLDLVQ